MLWIKFLPVITRVIAAVYSCSSSKPSVTQVDNKRIKMYIDSNLALFSELLLSKFYQLLSKSESSTALWFRRSGV